MTPMQEIAAQIASKAGLSAVCTEEDYKGAGNIFMPKGPDSFTFLNYDVNTQTLIWGPNDKRFRVSDKNLDIYVSSLSLDMENYHDSNAYEWAGLVTQNIKFHHWITNYPTGSSCSSELGEVVLRPSSPLKSGRWGIQVNLASQPQSPSIVLENMGLGEARLHAWAFLTNNPLANRNATSYRRVGVQVAGGMLIESQWS